MLEALGQPGGRVGAIDDRPQDRLHFAPKSVVGVVVFVSLWCLAPRAEDMGRWNEVIVAPIPGLQDHLFACCSRFGLERLELSLRDFFRQRPPTGTIAQENEEIGLWRNLLGARNSSKQIRIVR